MNVTQVTERVLASHAGETVWDAVVTDKFSELRCLANARSNSGAAQSQDIRVSF